MIRELKQAEYDMVKMAETATTSQQRQREKVGPARELTPRSNSPRRDTSAERQAASNHSSKASQDSSPDKY
jgi:hypothetical protein